MAALGSAKILVFRLYQVALAVAISIFLVRVLGSSSYGDYIFVMTIVTSLILPVQFGLYQLSVREIPHAQNPSIVVLWSIQNIGILIAIEILILGAAILWADAPPTRNLARLLVPSIILTALLSVAFFLYGILAANKMVVKENFLQNAVRPTLFLALILLGYLILGPVQFSPIWVMFGYIASIAIVIIVIIAKHRNLLSVSDAPTPSRAQRKSWRNAVLFLMAIGGIDLVLQNSDILMLGSILASEDVAIYRVSVVAAGLLGLPSSAVATYILPKFAAAQTDEEKALVQVLSIQLSRVSLVTTMLLFAGASLLGEQALSWVFGEEFERGHETLLILGSGSMLTAFSGLSRHVLTMNGHETTVFRILGLVALLNIMLNAVLITQFGPIGAAVATTGSVVVWNIWLHLMCKKTLGYGVTAFSSKLRNRETA